MLWNVHFQFSRKNIFYTNNSRHFFVDNIYRNFRKFAITQKRFCLFLGQDSLRKAFESRTRMRMACLITTGWNVRVNYSGSVVNRPTVGLCRHVCKNVSASSACIAFDLKSRLAEQFRTENQWSRVNGLCGYRKGNTLETSIKSIAQYFAIVRILKE